MSEIYKAILKVQQEAPTIDKSADNPFFKSKYADLPAIWNAIKGILGENNLVVTNQTDYADGIDFMITKITHTESGESIECKNRIILQKNSAQEYGSYITYMRRYALSAMLGLVTDEDDDGNKASANATVSLINAVQKTTLDNLLKQKGANVYAFLKHYKIEKIEDLPSNKFMQAKNALEAKPDVSS